MSERLRVRCGRVEIEKMMTAAIALAILVGVGLGCGQGAQTGPGEIHWDRQACEHCQMVISQRRHAVQVRSAGERKTHAFDDLGCALLWLDAGEEAAANEADVEIWVRDASRADWVEAREANFEDGQSTPMGYGFSSAREGLSFEAVRARVRETERARRSGGPRSGSAATDGSAEAASVE